MIDVLKLLFFRPKQNPDYSPLMNKDVQQQDPSAVLFGNLLIILKGYDQATEVGFNRAHWIDQINSWMGIPMGSAYCLSGILYCLKSLESSQGVKFDLPKIPGTQRFWASVKPSLKHPEPKAWSIGIMQSKINPTRGHAVLVVEDPAADGSFKTFEFNTDLHGSRDGDGAMFTKRNIAGTNTLKFLGFTSLKDALIAGNVSKKRHSIP